MIIYHYDPRTGCAMEQGVADISPLDNAALMPAFSTKTPPPDELGEHECARYLTATAIVPVCHDDGKWVRSPDWRAVPLWSTKSGAPVSITEPGVTPQQIDATTEPYPGPSYIWRDEQWQEDPAIKYQLAEQAAEQELAQRQAYASIEISRIKPAVDGGYAKPEDAALLPQLQRYLYELPDVKGQAGWPFSVAWPEIPQ